MLHIKFEEAKSSNKGGKQSGKLIGLQEDEEEQKAGDSGSAAGFIIDTSDMSSQSDGGSIYSKNSPTE